MESSRSYFQKKHKNGKNHADAIKGQTKKLGKENIKKTWLNLKGACTPLPLPQQLKSSQ